MNLLDANKSMHAAFVITLLMFVHSIFLSVLTDMHTPYSDVKNHYI